MLDRVQSSEIFTFFSISAVGSQKDMQRHFQTLQSLNQTIYRLNSLLEDETV